MAHQRLRRERRASQAVGEAVGIKVFADSLNPNPKQFLRARQDSNLRPTA